MGCFAVPGGMHHTRPAPGGRQAAAGARGGSAGTDKAAGEG